MIFGRKYIMILYNMKSLLKRGIIMERLQKVIAASGLTSRRKAEELEEIISCFDDDELIMVKSALEKINQY